MKWVTTSWTFSATPSWNYFNSQFKENVYIFGALPYQPYRESIFFHIAWWVSNIFLRYSILYSIYNIHIPSIRLGCIYKLAVLLIIKTGHYIKAPLWEQMCRFCGKRLCGTTLKCTDSDHDTVYSKFLLVNVKIQFWSLIGW